MADLTPARNILKPDQVDDVAQALLALARELWVCIDRQVVLEAVLARHGIDAASEVDAYVPDAVLQDTLDARRDRLVGAIASALSREPSLES